MNVVVRVKLLPNPEQERALRSTLSACNEAARFVAREAVTHGCFARAPLQKRVYRLLKHEFGLSAQPAVRVVKKVVDAYAAIRSRSRAHDRLGRRQPRAPLWPPNRPVRFRDGAAQPFDDRCLSWDFAAGTVSIWSVAGRLKGLRFTGEPSQLALLARHRRGESDLFCVRGKWYLAANCVVPEPPERPPHGGFLGVDLGIANIAVDSDGRCHAGDRLNAYRRRQARIRAELQSRETRSASRRLRRRAGREARHAANVNHVISKRLVAEAQRTGRGIALEDLTGIRERVRPHKPFRAAVHVWSFGQLRAFIAYKARRAGVALVVVDPAYTSQTCSACGHVSGKSRISRSRFVCRSCGAEFPADLNAARNVARRAEFSRAVVNLPHAAVPAAAGGVTAGEPAV